MFVLSVVCERDRMYIRKIEYTSVSISKPLVKEIKEYIAKDKKHISVGDFIRDAVREKLNYDKVGEKKDVAQGAKLTKEMLEDINLANAELEKMLESLGFAEKKTKKK